MARREVPLLKRPALAALCTTLPALGIAADASLHVYGAAQRELCLGLAASRRLPAQDSDKLAMACQSGAQVGAEHEYWGARLSDVLDQTGLNMPGRQDARRNYVVTRSSKDGYAIVSSWGELHNSEADDKILVVYQKNGLALDPGEGPLTLVSTGDLRNGSRHVKWLDSLEVVHLLRGPLATP